MKTLTSIAAFLLLPLTCLVFAEGESRTWTSSTGSKIEAEFISVTGGDPGTIEKVTLKTADGREITVRTSQLSEADRKWLAEKKAKAIPTAKTHPAPAPAAPGPSPTAGSTAGDLSDAEIARLGEILNKALEGNPPEAERKEASALFARLLPTKGADDEDVRWDVSIAPSGDDAPYDSVLISADLFPKAAADDDRDARLAWSHIVLQRDKPESYGFEKWGRYPVMRAEDRHMFVLVGRVEVRAVADHESYESDAKLEAVVEGMNLQVIKEL